MLTPKPATEIIRVRPACRLGGHRVAISITPRAPSDGAVRNSPSPTGPTWRMSEAKIGSSAMAPPKKTANRSSAIEPIRAGVFGDVADPAEQALDHRFAFDALGHRLARDHEQEQTVEMASRRGDQAVGARRPR